MYGQAIERLAAGGYVISRKTSRAGKHSEPFGPTDEKSASRNCP
jgi:hypothetical protein